MLVLLTDHLRNEKNFQMLEGKKIIGNVPFF